MLLSIKLPIDRVSKKCKAGEDLPRKDLSPVLNRAGVSRERMRGIRKLGVSIPSSWLQPKGGRRSGAQWMFI